MGSKADTLVELSGNSLQNLLYEAFCQLVFKIHIPIQFPFQIRQAANFAKNTNVHGESKQAQAKKAILKMLGE